MIYPRYSAMIGDLREAQQELEDFYAADQAQVLKDIEPLTKRERVSYLTSKSAAYTARMMQRWDKLYEAFRGWYRCSGTLYYTWL